MDLFGNEVDFKRVIEKLQRKKDGPGVIQEAKKLRDEKVQQLSISFGEGVLKKMHSARGLAARSRDGSRAKTGRRKGKTAKGR
jgi:hypothetical protein